MQRLRGRGIALIDGFPVGHLTFHAGIRPPGLAKRAMRCQGRRHRGATHEGSRA